MGNSPPSNALTAFHTVNPHQGTDGTFWTLSPGRGDPCSAPGYGRTHSIPEGGADHKHRLWGRTAWGRAAAGHLPAVRPSIITLPPFPKEMRGAHPGAPRRLSEVLHVNFVRQCRPSSVTAPSSVTVSVARVSCREGSLQSAFLQPTQQSKGQKTLRSRSPRAVALGGDAVPLKARTLDQTALPGGKSPLSSADMSRGIPRDFRDPTCCGLHGVPPKFRR